MSHSTGAIRLFFIQFDLRNKLDGSEDHLFYTWGIKDCETPKLQKKKSTFLAIKLISNQRESLSKIHLKLKRNHHSVKLFG